MAVHKFSDQELTMLLKTRDHAAFTEIYKRYWAVLFKHARRMLHDDDEAGDVVQEIFTQVWTKSAGIQFNTSLRSYLYAAVRNKTIDTINRSRLAKNYLASLQDFIDKGEYVTDDQIRNNEFAALIDREISQLPLGDSLNIEGALKKMRSDLDYFFGYTSDIKQIITTTYVLFKNDKEFTSSKITEGDDKKSISITRLIEILNFDESFPLVINNQTQTDNIYLDYSTDQKANIDVLNSILKAKGFMLKKEMKTQPVFILKDI